MATTHELQVSDHEFGSGHFAPAGRTLAIAVVIAVLLGIGSPTMPMIGKQDGPAAQPAEASADFDPASSQMTTPPTPMSFHRSGDHPPDRIADYAGGIAARVHTDTGEPIPGDLFLLMAVAGSDADAHLYDHTPYLREDIPIHPEAVESNQQAVRTIEEVTGADLQLVDFISAPGGGPSAGVTYAIAYLNIISDGAFTGDVVVAATGRLESSGYVYPINSIAEKTAAAHLADADVLFTPSLPAAENGGDHGTRLVGELFRARNTGSTLGTERQWGNYGRWGMNRSADDMDIVGIRHIGDIAAYLCGAGSDFACDITLLLEDDVIDTSPRARKAAPVTVSRKV